MNSTLRVPLNITAVEAGRLRELQAAFATACNALAPLVQKTRVWNRVALHHMAYKPLREQFPQMGSQLVCNAIYAVSRHSRLVYQSPDSPFNIAKLGDKPLPRLHFNETSPVYFDRHTLSLREGELSMYTLDGRMRFRIGLAAQDEIKFRTNKVREIVLTRSGDDFELLFDFAGEPGDPPAPRAARTMQAGGVLPEYMMVKDTSHERA
jgi:hypothetical protein